MLTRHFTANARRGKLKTTSTKVSVGGLGLHKRKEEEGNARLLKPLGGAAGRHGTVSRLAGQLVLNNLCRY